LKKKTNTLFNGRVKGSKVIKRITNPLAEKQQFTRL